jgi:lipopolysaccharide/colanic/teichoic acid biosynthesis glycosyltransferase
MDCYELGIRVRSMTLFYEQLTGRVPVEHVGDNWNIILPLEGRSAFDPYPYLKRLIDIVFSIVGLIGLAVMLPVLALIIYLDSPGPIFFAQERLGKAGKVYTLWKFRSMVVDAEVRAGPLWAVSNDPRITTVGSCIDELPQFWNVLVGEMSLIGPRPERPFFVSQLQAEIPFYRARLSVAPGLTGWAQVNYGYGSTVEDALIKLQYDLYYIRHHSLFLDLLIIMRTIGKVVRLQGT